ncbi:MAG: hypothetical protein RI885_1120, partial [Actinomycetota bacterium]
MSVDYYSRLEQARGPQPSDQMLAALARALRLSDDERDYLFRVAGHSPPDRWSDRPHVTPALLRVLDRLDDTPALVLSALAEPLVANRLAIALFGDPATRTGAARSDIYRWFTEPDTRLIYPESDRDRQGRALVAGLRAATAMTGSRSRAQRLVRILTAQSPEFAEIWGRHEVAKRFEDHKT